MRNVNLASYGVEELSEVQMREVSAGWWQIIVGFVASSIIITGRDRGWW